jgi:hypothetical protein
MNNNSLRNAIALLGAIAMPNVALAADSDWNWQLAPYLWASDVKADFGERSSTTSFSDIIDKLDFALLLRLEGQGDNWGMMLDTIYLDLGNDRDFPVGRTDADLSTTIVDLAAVYSPGAERWTGLEGFAGLRYMGVDFSGTLRPTNPALPGRELGVDEGLTDFLIGARYIMPLSDLWSVAFRADASFGDSEGSWSASVNTTRKIGRGALVLGYRYFELELQPRDRSFDLKMYGPQVGYAFQW